MARGNRRQLRTAIRRLADRHFAALPFPLQGGGGGLGGHCLLALVPKVKNVSRVQKNRLVVYTKHIVLCVAIN